MLRCALEGLLCAQDEGLLCAQAAVRLGGAGIASSRGMTVAAQLAYDEARGMWPRGKHTS